VLANKDAATTWQSSMACGWKLHSKRQLGDSSLVVAGTFTSKWNDVMARGDILVTLCSN